MGLMLAIRPVDGRTFVIPGSWSKNLQLQGWRVRPAPGELAGVDVKRPTVLEEVRARARSQAEELPPPSDEGSSGSVADPSSPRNPTIGEGGGETDVSLLHVEAAPPPPAKKKRRSKKKKEAVA